MNTKHTPGPLALVIQAARTWVEYNTQTEPDAETLAGLKDIEEACNKLERQENAAPELLEACRSLMVAYNEQTTPTHMEWRAIEAAIAKAEGRS